MTYFSPQIPSKIDAYEFIIDISINNIIACLLTYNDVDKDDCCWRYFKYYKQQQKINRDRQCIVDKKWM